MKVTGRLLAQVQQQSIIYPFVLWSKSLGVSFGEQLFLF